MAKMKYIYFNRQNNNFDDILKDTNIKKNIPHKISWSNWLVVGIDEEKNPQLISYINLVYGDSIRTNIHPDYSPIPGKDYQPKEDLSKWRK